MGMNAASLHCRMGLTTVMALRDTMEYGGGFLAWLAST